MNRLQYIYIYVKNSIDNGTLFGTSFVLIITKQWYWVYMPVDSLLPSDAIWRQRSWSTLAQIMSVAWQHQAITWTNVDLSSVRSIDNRLWAISRKISQPTMTLHSLKNSYSKLFPFVVDFSHFPVIMSSNGAKYLFIFLQNKLYFGKEKVNVFPTILLHKQGHYPFEFL